MQSHSHLSFATVVAIIYSCAGIIFFDITPERALLAAVVIAIAALLPDIESGQGPEARELGGLIAAVLPLLLFEMYPQLVTGGVARIALIVICCYLFTRVVVIRGLQKFTKPNGMVHSLPAAVITFELVYLLFYDLPWVERLFVATAAFAGFCCHLCLDTWSNVDLMGKAMGKTEKKPLPTKLFGSTLAPTLSMYVTMLGLGWIVVRDIYPNFKIVTNVQY